MSGHLTDARIHILARLLVPSLGMCSVIDFRILTCLAIEHLTSMLYSDAPRQTQKNGPGGIRTITSARLKHHAMVPMRRKQLLWCAAEVSTRRRRRSVIELLGRGDKGAVMCSTGHARAVLIMTRCAPYNESSAHTLRRAHHNMSSAHTHQYVRTYDCCKHHTRRGLHEHAGPKHHPGQSDTC